MIMKFLTRDSDTAFMWIDLSGVVGVAMDDVPWEIDLMTGPTDGIMLRIIPLDETEAWAEGMQRVLDAWQAARAKLQNPLFITGSR